MELPRSPFPIPPATQQAVPCLRPQRNPHGGYSTSYSTSYKALQPDKRGRLTGFDAAHRSAPYILNAPSHQLPSKLSFMKVCSPWPLSFPTCLLKPTSPVGTFLAPHRVGGGMCVLLTHPPAPSLTGILLSNPCSTRGLPSDPSLPWFSTFFPRVPGHCLSFIKDFRQLGH